MIHLKETRTRCKVLMRKRDEEYMYPNVTWSSVARVTGVGRPGVKGIVCPRDHEHLLRCVARISVVRSIVVVVFARVLRSAVSRNSPVTSVARKARENLSSNLELCFRFLFRCFFLTQSCGDGRRRRAVRRWRLASSSYYSPWRRLWCTVRL